MCSVDPDEVTEMVKKVDQIDLRSSTCRKCQAGEAHIVLREKDVYCRDCFNIYFIHKFRSTIGKSKQILHGDHVLVATSGGMSSAAMAHLIRTGLDENSHKKLRFNPTFLHVDESCLLKTEEESKKRIQKLLSEISALKFPLYIVPLEKVLESNSIVPTCITEEYSEVPASDSRYRERLKNLFSTCSSSTAKEDLLSRLRMQVICYAARGLNFKKVFVGDSSSKVATNVLVEVAQGRGSQLAENVHFKAVQSGTEVFRPMRELLQNEIEFYVKIHEVDYIDSPTLEIQGPSISSCTKSFIMGLQSEFPATVPTIFRTGNKLVGDTETKGKEEEMDTVCLLCRSSVDTYRKEASALYATKISHLFSRTRPPDPESKGNEAKTAEKSMNAYSSNTNSAFEEEQAVNCGGSCKCESDGGCKSNEKVKKILTKEDLMEFLCYGCRIIVREMAEIEDLPHWMVKEAEMLQRRKLMKGQIQDFLL
ncbi:cytosolic thiouridylase subunit 2 isoform X2 [Oratosquilla oratoria]